MSERPDRELYQAFAADPRFADDQQWQSLFAADGRLITTVAPVLSGLRDTAFPHPLAPLYRTEMEPIFGSDDGGSGGRWDEVFLPEDASVWVLPCPEIYDVFDRLGQADRFPRFLLAGARAQYRLDPAYLKVGILVAGGAAPGLNQAVDSIIKRHGLLATAALGWGEEPWGSGKVEAIGFVGGYGGILESEWHPLTHSDTDRRALDAGCWLKCLRAPKTPEVIDELVQRLPQWELDVLYTIGGEGTHKTALELSQRLRGLANVKCPVVVAGPKTMDRDINFVDATFGFRTTVDAAKDLILRMHAEAQTLNRLAIVELFGANSGFVALHAAYTSGEVDYVLIPEMVDARGVEDEVDRCIDQLASRIRKKEHAVLVVAEGASTRWCNETHEHQQAAFKAEAFAALVARITQGLEERAQADSTGWPRGFGVFANEPRHLIRSTSPNTFDLDLCKYTGKLMVDTALAGRTQCSVNLWNGRYCIVPLEATAAQLAKVDLASYYFLSMLEKYFLS